MVQREQIAEALRAALAEEPGLAAAFLFGSVARSEATEASDVDVGLLFEESPPATFDGLRLDLQATLEQVLGRSTQIVVMNRAPVDLVHRILRDGILVNESNPSVRVRFTVKARNEYFDLLPHLQRYRRALRTSDLPGGSPEETP